MRSAFPAALTILLLVCVLAAPVQAHDSDGDSIDDGFEDALARNVVWTASPAVNPVAFAVQSQSMGSGTNDALSVRYEEARFDVVYRPNASSSVGVVEFQLRFDELAEWQDNGDGVLSGGELVSRWDVPQVVRPLTVEQGLTSDGEGVTTFHVTLLPGQLAADVHVVSRFGLVDGILVSPMSVKVDLRIAMASYNATASVPAVKVVIETESSLRQEDPSFEAARQWARDEAGVNISLGGSSAFFSWAKNATVDGSDRPVRATKLETEDSETEFWLTYARGAVVVHDPKVGVVSKASLTIISQPPTLLLQPDLGAYVAGATVLASLVAVTAYVRNRGLRGKRL